MRYAIALLLGATLAIPAQAQNAPAAKTVQDARQAKVEQAIAKIRASDPTGAIAIIDPVLADFDREYPASGPGVLCASDSSEVLMGLLTSAAAKKDAVALSDTWCYALWAKGYSLVELGRLDEAIAPLTRATVMMPGNSQFHTELGYVHQSLKHWKESHAAYAAAAEAAQSMKDEKTRNVALRRAWFGLGYNEIELGQFDAAEKHMKQALAVAPGDQKIIDELEYIRQQKAKAKGKNN
ncbi:MAG: tetratricopeptide repeat protein [Pseudomonadota bacterium]